MNDSISVCENYGPVKAGQDYRVLGDHYDYVSILCHGKPICLPYSFIAKSAGSSSGGKRYFNDLPTYEDIIEAEQA